MARIGLSANRKFIRLARALGNAALARGVLELLWDPCYEAADAYVGTAADIEALCDWRGKPGVLTAALLEAGAPKGAGFIEPCARVVRDATEPHYQVHDLFDHCPEYARMRRNAALAMSSPRVCERCGGTYTGRSLMSRFCSPRCKQAAYFHRHRVTVSDGQSPSLTAINRHAAVSEANVTATDRHVTVTDRHGHRHADETAGTSTYVLPVHAVSTQEEDANSTPVRTKSGATKNGVTVTDRHTDITIVVPDDPLVLTFPTIGLDGAEWYLNQSQVDQWTELYPGLDVLAECRKALGWVSSDRTRRKTKRGMAKFLVGWFNRSTERGGRPALITGSLKTAGNQAALEAFLNRRRE